MTNKRSYIRPDETLYVDGKLIVRGNITQVERTIFVNNLENDTLVVNSDANTDQATFLLRSAVRPSVDGNICYDGNVVTITPDVLIPQTLFVNDVYVYTELEFDGDADFGPNAVQRIREKFSAANTPGAGYNWTASNLSYDVFSGVFTQTAPTDSEVWNIFQVTNVNNVTDWSQTRLEYNNDGDIRYVAPTQSEVRATISITQDIDPSGWSNANVEYDTANGVISYTQPTQAEVRRTITVTRDIDASGWSAANVTYNDVTGVIDYVQPTQAEVRNTISATSTQDASGWSLGNVTYDAITGVIDYTQPTQLEVRSTISVVDLGGQGNLSYSNANGVITYVGPSQDEANDAILAFISADYGINLSANGSLSVDVAETATLSDNQTFTGDKTFTGLVDLTGASVPGYEVTGDMLINGNLNVLGNVNSITRIDVLVEDNEIVLNSNSAVAVDAFLTVNRGAATPVSIKWDQGNVQWEFTNDGVTYRPIPVTTTDLLEGTNLYFTDERVDDRVANLMVAGANLTYTYDDSVNTLTLTQQLTTDDISEGTNLYYTPARANIAVEDFLIAGNGLIRTGTEYIQNVGQGDGILVDSNNVNVDATVIRTSGDFTLGGDVTFTGNLVIPDTTNGANGAIYYNSNTNQAFVTINNQQIELTPSIDFGSIESAPGANVAQAEIYAGNRVQQVANANITYAGIKGISVGANMTLVDSGNVITLDADGLNTAEVRAAFSVVNNNGLGNLLYNSTTGVFTHLGVSQAEIRSQFAGNGLITYVPQTGTFSTSADNYSNWTVRTGSGVGAQADISSGEVLTFQGAGGLTVSNSGNVITITSPGGDITGVQAGDGLSGGGTSGTVTLDVDNTVVRTAGNQTISGEKIFTETLFVTGDSGTGAGSEIDLTDDQSPALPARIKNSGTFNAGAQFNTSLVTSGTLQYSAAGHFFADNSVVLSGIPQSWYRINNGHQWGNSSGTTPLMELNNTTGDLTLTSGQFVGTATSALYADLAELYTADKDYEPGTVVIFGGYAEVTASGNQCDHRVAGVVSTNPAHLMNSECPGLTVAVALRGRVPCKVIGQVRKGDILITSDEPGHAVAATNPLSLPAAAIIGKAITSKTEAGKGVVEILV